MEHRKSRGIARLVKDWLTSPHLHQYELRRQGCYAYMHDCATVKGNQSYVLCCETAHYQIEHLYDNFIENVQVLNGLSVLVEFYV